MARPRSDIRERLLKAARRHFLAHGVDGASLREIAREARTSLGMVTYYFPSKDDLLLAVLERVYPRVLADVKRALASDRPLAQRIEQVYARLHAADEEEFAVVRIVLREALVSSRRLKKVVARFTAEGAHLPLLLGTLGEGAAKGSVREDLPPLALLASTIALGLAPVVARRLADGIGLAAALPAPEEAAKAMATILFEGIGGRPRAPRPRPPLAPERSSITARSRRR
jgi:AcrR family transcriptional regulator